METNSIKFKLVIWRYFNPFLFCTNGSFQLRDDLKVLNECKGNMPAL